MYTAEDEAAAVGAKSRGLIDATMTRVQQIDGEQFPTATSEAAKQMLAQALEALRAKGSVADPEVRYNGLLRLQRLVDLVEGSSSRLISWPLVSYCDVYWDRLFGRDGPRIFYTVSAEYNYSITSFSQELERSLRDVLPRADLQAILGPRPVYCLHLASLEHTNLPLYANITHEFGHALFDVDEAAFLAIGLEVLDEVLGTMEKDTIAEGGDKAQIARRLEWLIQILQGLLQEVVADLTGALLAGPAYYCSLSEMAWGSPRNEWPVRLLEDGQVEAHPGTNFRLDLIRRVAQIDTLHAAARAAARTGVSRTFLPTFDLLATRRVTHDDDTAAVLPQLHPDVEVITKVLVTHLRALKVGLETFVERCNAHVVSTRFAGTAPALLPSDVDALLQRLEHDVVPNIISDSSLLGRPARFLPILNAAALHRLHHLVKKGGDQADQGRALAKVERLTEKALEVSFVQRQYAVALRRGEAVWEF